MSTFELIFPSKAQIDKNRELFSHVQWDAARGAYRPTDDVVRAAWNEIVEAGNKVRTRKSSTAVD